MGAGVPDASDWRPLIQRCVTSIWPDLLDGPIWVEAQCQAESHGDPIAVSPAGAQGLLQLMPMTAAEVGVTNPFDPEDNLRGGIRYLKKQYLALKSLPDPDRLYWAFSAYNGGLGYTLKALATAKADNEPDATSWEVGRFWFMHYLCQVKGKRPDYNQIWHYVRRIRREFSRLRSSIE